MLCCAWQVSHCSSAGLSPEQVQQGSAPLLSPDLWSCRPSALEVKSEGAPSGSRFLAARLSPQIRIHRSAEPTLHSDRLRLCVLQESH